MVLFIDCKSLKKISLIYEEKGFLFERACVRVGLCARAHAGNIGTSIHILTKYNSNRNS